MKHLMSQAEWDWVREHPEDPDARAVSKLAQMGLRYFGPSGSGLAEQAVVAVRRKMAAAAGTTLLTQAGWEITVGLWLRALDPMKARNGARVIEVRGGWVRLESLRRPFALRSVRAFQLSSQYEPYHDGQCESVMRSSIYAWTDCGCEHRANERRAS